MSKFFVVSGGHKEFHRKHKQYCEYAVFSFFISREEDPVAATSDSNRQNVVDENSTYCSSAGNMLSSSDIGDQHNLHSSKRLPCEQLQKHPSHEHSYSDSEKEKLEDGGHPISKVLPYLYLGSAKDANDHSILKRLGVNRVLNIASQLLENHFESNGIIYKHITANDSVQQNLIQYFEQAFDFIGTYHSHT